MLRHATIFRNVFLKKFTVLRQQHSTIKQVPIHMLSHLKGITEYGHYWNINAVQNLTKCIHEFSFDFFNISESFKTLLINQQVDFF